MRTLGALFAVGFAGLLAGDALAANQPVIICSARVNSFIEQIHFGDRFSGSSKILAAQGYFIQWSNAIAGEGPAPDERGGIQNLKIFAVPFIDAGGTYRASIIGGIIQSENAEIHEFIITAGIDEGDALLGGPAIAGNIGRKAGIAEIDIKPVLASIMAGSRSEIWEYIIRNIPSRADSGIAIRAALESHGFSCSPAPVWFYQKGIWYLTTCILPTAIAAH